MRQKYDVTHNPDVFGTSGPIQISYNEEYSASHALWHKTLNTLGVETNPAHHAGSNVGVWTNINTVDPQKAARSYSENYINSLVKHGNLHIVTRANVQNVNLAKDGDDFVATGVTFECGGQTYTASASREVVISAGSAKSPQILEYSGIGQPDVLQSAGIPLKVDSPMVGENLQDHISTNAASRRRRAVANITSVDNHLRS